MFYKCLSSYTRIVKACKSILKKHQEPLIIMSLTLQDFLSNAKCLSKNPSQCSTIHIVLGNESCDLDSSVSAILYAFFLAVSGESGVMPILNIPASHLPIKTEVVKFLGDNGVCLENLVFRDSLNLQHLTQSSKLKVTLVDHHVLASQDHFLKPFVVEILDHRPISPTESWSELERGSTLDVVGSCATHVAKKILLAQPELVSKNRNIANLIYGTILLDTACLSPQANRATPSDHEVINQLKAFHPDLEPESSLFESLVEAKSDISHLTSAQLLVKDLKFTKHGVPIIGLPILVQDLVAKDPDLKSTLTTFLSENHASLLVLMGLNIRAGVMTRDLGLFSLTPDNVQIDAIVTVLSTNENPSLGMAALPREEKSERCEVRLYRCDNVQVSRKQVLPLVEKALESKVAS